MVRIPDVTAAVPVRRMSVARGTLRVPSSWEPSAEHLAAARAAALMAAKESARLLPSAVPFQLTDAFCDVEASASAGEWIVTCTMTVQGFARSRISASAILGAVAALASLGEAAGFPEGLQVTDVHVVQDVEG